MNSIKEFKNMKAAVFEKQGLNLQVVDNADKPEVKDHDVLIKVKMAGVNPIDYTIVTTAIGVKPIPRIPGAERQ